MIIDEICDQLPPSAASCQAIEVRIGLGYTAVQLDNGRCGLAFTFRQGSGGGCCALKESGTLAGRSATDTVGMVGYFGRLVERNQSPAW